MRIRITIFMLTVMAALVMKADNVSLDSLASRLNEQRFLFPQEKIHVTTDQSIYTANDTVWFRAWVVDAATHRQVAASKYVYVELLSPFGEVIDRVKVRHEDADSLFAGYIPLDAELPEGNYTLTAYTMFMESLGPDYFFRKPLTVLSPFGARENIAVEVIEQDPDFVKLAISCADTQGNPRHYEKMSVTTRSGKQISGGRGSRTRNIRINRDDCPGRTILVQFDNHSRYVVLPPWEGQLEVTFHPEGGYLIPGKACKVGFKAIDGSGRGVDVSGVVLSEAGDTVARFASTHRGIGTFVMVPAAGATYRAVVEAAGSGTREFALPAPEPDAAVLHVDQHPRSIAVEAVGRVPEGALVVAQQRGVLQFAGEVKPGVPLTINPAGLDEGILQLYLFDSALNPLSERLVFISHPSEPEVKVNITH